MHAERFWTGAIPVGSTGTRPNANWDYAEVWLNDYATYPMRTYYGAGQATRVQAAMAHEMGHGMGLAHTGTTTRIMYDTLPLTAVVPAAGDVSALDAAY